MQYIPDTLKTPEMCMTAVSSHHRLLKYVPESLQTEELCVAALYNKTRIENIYNKKNISSNLLNHKNNILDLIHNEQLRRLIFKYEIIRSNVKSSKKD